MVESIVLGGGCFWCTQAVFSIVEGVLSAIPGYAGGNVPYPDYDMVGSGTTGHAEVVKVDFDQGVVPLPDLLDIFFSSHDPTTPNRQGPDIGPQYRSIILFSTQEQRQQAAVAISREESRLAGRKVVTQVKRLLKFYPAEISHHDYYAKNRGTPYCRLVIAPKLRKLAAGSARPGQMPY